MGLFDKKDKAESKNALTSQSEMKRPGDEISEEVLREIVGGGDCFFDSSTGTYREHEKGDVREGISEENADQGYAAGQMNDVDGWD